jgi:hypothetical protein
MATSGDFCVATDSFLQPLKNVYGVVIVDVPFYLIGQG